MWYTRFLTLLCLCVLIHACKRPDPIRLQPTIEEPATLVSTIRIADPSSSAQLVRGFYPLESNRWRWAARTFSVALGTPASARTNGAWLVLAFNLPPAWVQALNKLTLTAKAGGVELAAEEFT